MAGRLLVLAGVQSSSAGVSSQVKDKETFNEVKHLGLQMLQKESNTDGGEIAVSHLLVFQHPLQESLHVCLSSLQPLTTPC